MIYDNVPEGVEILPTGFDQIQPSTRKPMHVEWYTELLGGLGDALLRVYNHEHCYASLARLSQHQKAAVVLMCHNPALAEIFKWHPMFISGQLSVFDLGFRTPFHPWENLEFRLSHGMPEKSPCPMGGPPGAVDFFPSLSDQTVLQSLKMEEPYLILHASAGQQDRDLPSTAVEKMVNLARRRKYNVFTIGHSKYVRHPAFPGADNLVDKLSVPGMILAIRRAAGIITSHSSVTHVAWYEHRPVFMLYPTWVKDSYVSRGAVGYMVGIDRPSTDHMLFDAFTEERFDRWLENIS